MVWYIGRLQSRLTPESEIQAYHYKIENLPGYFRCSDEFLNKIWDAGTWTGLINQIPARVNSQYLLGPS
jgi:hypothetical protein